MTQDIIAQICLFLRNRIWVSVVSCADYCRTDVVWFVGNDGCQNVHNQFPVNWLDWLQNA